MSFELKITGANAADLFRQVELLYSDYVSGPIEDQSLDAMPLQDLIEYARRKAEESGWLLTLSPIEMEEVVDQDEGEAVSVSEDPAASEKVDHETLKRETIQKLKELNHKDPSKVQELRKRFGGKLWSEHPASAYAKIAEALKEAIGDGEPD